MAEVEWTLLDERIEAIARKYAHQLSPRCSGRTDAAVGVEDDEYPYHSKVCDKSMIQIEQAIRTALKEALRPHADVQECEPLVLYFQTEEDRDAVAQACVDQMKKVRVERV